MSVGHDHTSPSQAGNERRTLLAAVLTGCFMLAEVVGGLLAGSLALLADAAHMLTDSVALGLSWFAFRLTRRPADWRRTYGFDRLQVLVAFANGLLLFLLTAWIVVEAVRRVVEPVEVIGGVMLVVALLGLVVNIACFVILHGGDQGNLNLRAALLHVVGDLLGSAAALLAAIVIMTTGWTIADPLLSMLVAALILRAAYRVLRESAHILLEGAPRSLDVRAIGPDLERHIEAVEDVHHVHAWSLTEEKPLLTLHARIEANADGDGVIGRIKARLVERFGIEHATVQLERSRCEDTPNTLTG